MISTKDSQRLRDEAFSIFGAVNTCFDNGRSAPIILDLFGHSGSPRRRRVRYIIDSHGCTVACEGSGNSSTNAVLASRSGNDGDFAARERVSGVIVRS